MTKSWTDTEQKDRFDYGDPDTEKNERIVVKDELDFFIKPVLGNTGIVCMALKCIS